MSPSPHGISNIQTAFIEWQSNIRMFLPPPKFLGLIPKAKTKVTLRATKNVQLQELMQDLWFRIITALKRSCGKIMFLYLSVSHSVHREGCIPQYTLGQGVCIPASSWTGVCIPACSWSGGVGARGCGCLGGCAYAGVGGYRGDGVCEVLVSGVGMCVPGGVGVWGCERGVCGRGERTIWMAINNYIKVHIRSNHIGSNSFQYNVILIF